MKERVEEKDGRKRVEEKDGRKRVEERVEGNCGVKRRRKVSKRLKI